MDGANLDSLRCSDIPQFPVPIPPLSEQRAIAHILGTLDDKIELNRRMNETLEAMARALFKSWFVDFDPVRAKAGGRQPAGMDADHCDSRSTARFAEFTSGESQTVGESGRLEEVAFFITGAVTTRRDYKMAATGHASGEWEGRIRRYYPTKRKWTTEPQPSVNHGI